MNQADRIRIAYEVLRHEYQDIIDAAAETDPADRDELVDDAVTYAYVINNLAGRYRTPSISTDVLTEIEARRNEIEHARAEQAYIDEMERRMSRWAKP